MSWLQNLSQKVFFQGESLCFHFHRVWEAMSLFWVKENWVWLRKTPGTLTAVIKNKPKITIRHVIHILLAQTHSKKNLWLTFVQCTVCIYIDSDVYVTFKSLCIFRTRGPDTNKNDSDNPTSKTASRLLTEMIQPHRLFQPRLNTYSDFLRVPQRSPVPTNQQEVV